MWEIYPVQFNKVIGVNTPSIALYTVSNNLLILTELSASTVKISCCSSSSLSISASSIAFYIGLKEVSVFNNKIKELSLER